MLSPGLYEQIINTALNRELSAIPAARKSVAPIDKAEASKVLAQYLADVVQKGLENVVDNGGDISTQISLANQIVTLIQNTTQEADFAALSVDQRAEQLLALLREQDPRLAVGKTAADLSRPETSIAQSSLFTGAIHEPQMYTELKKEIVSADRIDMLVSFIKWSGLRLLMDELREFTQNGGELRIVTTSYMGATDVKAIEELRALPNTQIKVSYDTKRTRLHAKTYVFYRDTGFTTAYVGSSNLSNAAISSGLEWNVKVTRRDLPETIDKIAATFESYWNSSEFEYYSEDQKERLARALRAEKILRRQQRRSVHHGYRALLLPAGDPGQAGGGARRPGLHPQPGGGRHRHGQDGDLRAGLQAILQTASRQALPAALCRPSRGDPAAEPVHLPSDFEGCQLRGAVCGQLPAREH